MLRRRLDDGGEAPLYEGPMAVSEMQISANPHGEGWLVTGVMQVSDDLQIYALP